MGMRVSYLGQEGPTGTIEFDPASKRVSWNVQGISAARVRINGTHWADTGTSGSGVIPDEWVPPHTLQLLGYGPGVEGPLLATLTINADWSWSSTSSPSQPAQPPPPGPQPGASWFEQNTNVLGVDIPNLALAAGGGLLALAVIRKKKGLMQ